MAFDVTLLRAHFPSLTSGIAHFDGPGGTQTPSEVGEAIARTLTGPLSNRGRAVASEVNADDAVTAFREAYADFLNVSPRCVVHGRSATQLTFDFSRALAKQWSADDEIVVSRLDHDCNVRPWVIAAQAVGARVRWLDLDPATGEFDDASLDVVTERTKLVAVTGASNVLGTKPPLKRIADAAHEVGALLWVDGVHYSAHTLVDVPAIGADFFVCSPYKFLGPHCGVLGARSVELLESLHPDKLLPSTNEVPERFELGTLPYETLAGASAAVDFLAAIDPGGATDRRRQLANSWASIHEHEARLLAELQQGIDRLGDAVVVHSKASDRTPTVLLTFPGHDVRKVAAHLAERDVQAPASSFYAYETCERLGLGEEGGLRIGIAPYNDEEDVHRALDALADALDVG